MFLVYCGEDIECVFVNVDSTRKQYEKKLEKAMEKSSDKTYYREEGRMLVCRACVLLG